MHTLRRLPAENLFRYAHVENRSILFITDLRLLTQLSFHLTVMPWRHRWLIEPMGKAMAASSLNYIIKFSQLKF